MNVVVNSKKKKWKRISLVIFTISSSLLLLCNISITDFFISYFLGKSAFGVWISAWAITPSIQLGERRADHPVQPREGRLARELGCSSERTGWITADGRKWKATSN